MSSSRRVPRTLPPAGSSADRNLLAYAVLGSRRVRAVLLWWHLIRKLAQWCNDHRRAALVTVLVLVATTFVGSLAVVLGSTASLGWLVLGYERRAWPQWRTTRSGRPWQRAAIRANGPRWPWWRGFLDGRDCTILAAGHAGFLLVLLPQLTTPALVVLLSAGSLWWLVKVRVAPAGRDEPWRMEQLLAMFTDPGVDVLPAPKRGERAEWLRRVGTPRKTKRGTAVRVQFTGGVHHARVTAKVPQMTAYHDLPAGMFRAYHEPGTPESQVQLEWLKPREATAGGLSPVATALEADATLPVEVGEDEETNERLSIELLETNDLDTGVPGAGKTEGARPVLGTVLLDQRPRCHGQRGAWLFGCDGKGSRKDYGLVAPLAEAWVWGTDEDAPEKLALMLEKVLAIVRYRNRVDEDGALDWPAVLVWLEEFQDIRDAADGDQQARIDKAMRRIVRMGRAVRVRVRIITQRSSVDDLPSSYRNLLVNRTAYRAAQTRDYSLALGSSGNPELRLPKAKHGQAILRLPGGYFPLVPDRFPLEQWVALCKRATQLRKDRPAPTYFVGPIGTPTEVDLEQLDDELEEAVPVDVPVVDELEDPFLDAVCTVLGDRGPLPSGELLDALPDEHKAGHDARSLGVVLARDYPEVLVRSRSGGTRRWSVAGTVTSTRVDRHVTVVRPLSERGEQLVTVGAALPAQDSSHDSSPVLDRS